MDVCATTACWPGREWVTAARGIAAGLRQEPWGVLSAREVQLCPQNAGVLTSELVDEVQTLLPGSRLRLHATVRVRAPGSSSDHQWWTPDSAAYYGVLACLSRHLHAPAYVFHAPARGAHRHGPGDLAEVVSMAHRLSDLFACPVGVEAQYPAADDPARWLLADWAEYRWLQRTDIAYAIDLSHLHILVTASGQREDNLVRDLLLDPRCLEIHVSDNDGRRDQHRALRADAEALWWWPLLQEAVAARPDACVFSEAAEPRLAPVMTSGATVPAYSHAGPGASLGQRLE